MSLEACVAMDGGRGGGSLAWLLSLRLTSVSLVCYPQVFKSTALEKIIRSCPAVLRKGAETDLQEKFAMLQDILPRNNVRELINKFPAIMSR